MCVFFFCFASPSNVTGDILHRNCEHPTFINEDLSKPTAELFNHARNLVKAKKIYKTWTSGGSVYVKLSDLPSCKPKLVKSTDLPNI